MASYEQYGKGPFGVRISRDGCLGQYRFETEAEAREYQKKHGGTLFHSDEPLGDIREMGAQLDRADHRPGAG